MVCVRALVIILYSSWYLQVEAASIVKVGDLS